MSKQQLFQYAVIRHPDKKQEKEGQKARLEVPIMSVLAKDEEAVKILAAKAIPESSDHVDQYEILIRPF